MFATATAPAASAELRLSPALQAYLRNCVRECLQSQGHQHTPWFRIHLYLRMGDPASAMAVDRDLRQPTGGAPEGLIALFGELAPGLTIQTAMARQLHLMHGCDTQLQVVSKPSESHATHLQLGEHGYDVLTLHGDADCLHRVMPCPMLVFYPST